MFDFPDEAIPASAAPARTRVAVSIKQPWATLVVHGLKTIELRQWQPRRRGELYIHTGANSDPTASAWANVPPSLMRDAKLRRGLVGRVRLAGVKRYATLDEFRNDRGRHLAPEAWFNEHGIFGWELESPERITFEPCPGNLRLFRV